MSPAQCPRLTAGSSLTLLAGGSASICACSVTRRGSPGSATSTMDRDTLGAGSGGGGAEGPELGVNTTLPLK